MHRVREVTVGEYYLGGSIEPPRTPPGYGPGRGSLFECAFTVHKLLIKERLCVFQIGSESSDLTYLGGVPHHSYRFTICTLYIHHLWVSLSWVMYTCTLGQGSCCAYIHVTNNLRRLDYINVFHLLPICHHNHWGQPSQQRGEVRAVTMFHEAICLMRSCEYVSEGAGCGMPWQWVSDCVCLQSALITHLFNTVQYHHNEAKFVYSVSSDDDSRQKK